MSVWYFSFGEPECIGDISYDGENTAGMINGIIIVT